MTVEEATTAAPMFERTPPQDVAAEQCVLGGMMLSKDAIADVVEILRVNDFYRPAHATIFDAILDLYGRGEPADAVVVAAALENAGELVRIGGAPYLHTLISTVPTAANAAYYARIVSERAVLRRLVEAGTKIVQLGYGSAAGAGRDVDDIVDLAQQAIYDVTERRVSEDFAILADMLQPTLDEIEAVGAQGGLMTGVPTGFTDLDRLLNGLQPGQLIVVAGRPGLGKSTASMDFARNAAVRFNLASAIFSLEMSKVEIVMRLLAAEARVPLHVLRSGQLSDDDWTKLARRMGEISEAPIFVDDTPNMTLMEVRAKARRLKQRHDLKLIVVDYLQLMSAPKRVESRQQEVAELSRGLKLLAKEVECPVIAVSQLNRGPEQRTDKRPQLSDLRESGCLVAETRIIRADTNAECTLGELFAVGAKDVPVWALNERLQYQAATMTHVFPSGHREVFRLRLASGKTIDATANHPFLTFDGWVPLSGLAVGSRVGTPRHVPPPLVTLPRPEEEIVLLAHLLGDGSSVPRQPLRSASADEENLLDRLRLFGRQTHERSVPPGVFGLPKEQVKVFLHHLWATGGAVSVFQNGCGGRVYLGSTSTRLLEDVSRLLLRFGITGRLHEVRTSGSRPRYTLDISGRDDQLRFLREIGVHGVRGEQRHRLERILGQVSGNTNVDTVPREVWDRVRGIMTGKQITHREFAAATGTQRAPSRQRLARIAEVLDSANLDLEATNDLFWDQVAGIESVGYQDVYDATVLGGHNFIANGVSVHNSIEQDADVVILLHRDDYYDKESPRAGEADFIVAKHRNGPTDTITVAAQLHLSRFVDMAIG
jgi:replicative DNA helicase